MADKIEKSCFECEYYTRAIGEKGYCKFYHHESALPEKACPKFEEKKIKEKKADVPETVDPLSRRILNIVTVGAFLASTVFTILAFVSVLVFIMTIFPIDEIPAMFKVFVSVAGILAVLLFTYILFTLGKKYAVARVVEMIFAVILAFIFLTYLDKASFLAHTVILKVVDILVNLFK